MNFRQLTREAEAAAQALVEALQSGLDSEAITNLLQAVNDNCKGCRKVFATFRSTANRFR